MLYKGALTKDFIGLFEDFEKLLVQECKINPSIILV